MNHELTMAFIGGGNMASALASGLIGKRCGASDVHVVDIDEQALSRWREQGVSTASAADGHVVAIAEQALSRWREQGVSTASAADQTLSTRRVWIFAVKPQVMKETVAQCKPFLRPDTLVISIAAGIESSTLAGWLGSGT